VADDRAALVDEAALDVAAEVVGGCHRPDF
jgi:hypothetical protein